LEDITILKNAHIYPSASRSKNFNWLAISGEKIISAGAGDVYSELEKRAARSYDLDGKTVLPGFTDAHIHLEKYAYSLDQVDCETKQLDDCLERIRSAALYANPGDWIRGHGWNQNEWGRFGTLSELDLVAPDNPVYLTAKSLHAAWVNSRALTECNIQIESGDIPRENIGLNPDGTMNGILYEDAMTLVSENIPRPTIEETVTGIERAQTHLLHYGITSVHDFDGQRCLQAIQELRRSGKQQIRVIKNLQKNQMDAAEMLGLQSGFGDDWIRIGHLKLFADGALGPQTAAMIHPYEAQPENSGMLLLDQEEITNLGRRALNMGFPLSVHAIGDRACRTVIGAFLQLKSEGLNPPLPHRIEHLQIVHPSDLEFLPDANITISMQPLHAPSDHPTAERYWGQRSRWSYAWNSVMETGSLLLFGSDAPVESPDPLKGIYAAITRKLATEDQASPTWIPEECLDLEAALKAYTLNPPAAVGCANHLGRLEPGYLADLIVLEGDPFQSSIADLLSLEVQGVMTGGVWRFLES
jgi:predicted amidohydrolase YtcJ